MSQTAQTLDFKTIGLFGTCGGSRWRDAFMARYAALNIPFFNPQVDNWTPELAAVEAEHLANDKLILMPVTGETYGAGSLAEVGFAALTTLKANPQRVVIFFIEPTVNAELAERNPEAAKDSNRARKLVVAHLKAQEVPNVYVAESLEQMLELSLDVYSKLVG